MGLKECPFCGGEAHMAERITYGGKMYGVSCSTPLCPGSEPWPWCMDAEYAEKAWNTRSERTCHMIDNGCELCCSECDARHEVAARLRNIDAERLDRVYGMDGEGGECEDPGMSNAGRDLMLGAIAEAVGMHFAPYYFDAAPLRDRLADLIDPDTTTDTTKDAPASPIASPTVDRDALLELADEMNRNARESEAYFAGIHPSEVIEYADRIREALGVADAD